MHKIIYGGRKILLAKEEDVFSILWSKESNFDQSYLIPESINQPGKISKFKTDKNKLSQVMKSIRKTQIVHHSYYEIGENNRKNFFIPTDRIHIQAKEGVTSNYIKKVANKYSLKFLCLLGNDICQYRITNATGMNPIKLCSLLNEDSNLSIVEPDIFIDIAKTAPYGIENKPSQWNNQWNLKEDSGKINIRADKAWEISKGNQEVVIAVLDDGFDFQNKDLNTNIMHPMDFFRPTQDNESPIDLDPSSESETGDYHGTPCAGLAIGRGFNNIIGVAPNCGFMPVRIPFGFTSESYLVKIFKHISPFCDVVSCSWNSDSTAWIGLSSVTKQLFKELTSSGGRRKKGLVVCFSAGNRNLPTYLSAEQNPIGMEYYGRDGTVLGHFFKNKELHSGWGELENVVIVASVTSEGRKSLYSNWGKNITVACPSDNYHPKSVSTRENYMDFKLATTENEANGLGLKEVGLSDQNHGFFTLDFGGTSGAAPQAAGACGLIISVNQELTALEVINILKLSANKCVDLELDENDMYNNRLHRGQFDVNGHSIWFGHGVVDVKKALELTLK